MLDWTNYNKFINSERWNELRKARLKIAGYRCEYCLKKKPLDVHHKTYERFGGRESMNDLLALCRLCHKEFDKKRQDGLPQEIPTRIPPKPKNKRLKILIQVSKLDNWCEYKARIIEGNKKHVIFRKGFENKTINQLQLLGFIETLKYLNKSHIITLCSTNNYVYRCLQTDKPKANLELIAELKPLTKRHKLIYQNKPFVF